MSTLSQYESSSAEGPPPSVQWRSWPLGESFLGTATVLLGLVGAGVGVGWITGQTHLALLAASFLAVALWRFFAPTWFELSPEGVTQWRFGRHRRIPWSQVRSYELCSHGVLLLPVEDHAPIDAYRGLYLPWGKNSDEVLAHVYYYIDRMSGA